MKVVEVRNRLWSGVRKKASCQQIDRVPDTPLTQDSINDRQYSHSRTSGETAPETRRNRIDLHRQSYTVPVWRDCRSVDSGPPGTDGRDLSIHRDEFMPFLRQY